MPRRSERSSTKKTKASPEKKLDKVKRTRTRRRKQSVSSDNDSAGETAPVHEAEIVAEVEKKPVQSPAKEASPEESQEVWQVKAPEGGDMGEIKKLKICLTRPPSTPERADRSPRSKRKHSRATSSSDTPSVEGVEEKKKTKHRSKRLNRESKDSEKNDSQEDLDIENEPEKSSNEISQSTDNTISDDTPMSTTNDDSKSSEVLDKSSKQDDHSQEKPGDSEPEQRKSSDADTTVASPKVETTAVSETDLNESKLKSEEIKPVESQRDPLEDKSEVLEIHAEDNRCESLDIVISKSPKGDKDKECEPEDKGHNKAVCDKVSKNNEDETDSLSKEKSSDFVENNKSTDKTNVVECSNNLEVRKVSIDSSKDAEDSNDRHIKVLERSESVQSSQDDNSNAPIVISRKRRWGSRPNKVSTQKSITISTDVLKEIIPDVKPAEFEEVIEEKINKREVREKIERPILPKIIIDNSDNVEQNKKNDDEKEREILKNKDSNLSANRKISIVKDNNSIIARPPSPPRHKQSCILFITNLVRPFTLPQLKNLLQRTGRIAEEGFWIDRIKSKCFVKYETEDQAVETRHALHGVTWPVSNPKTLQVDFSTEDAFDKAKLNEETDNAQASSIPGTVEDWLREQDIKREREVDKPFERKIAMREWDVGKNEKDKEKEKLRRFDERPMEKRRHRSMERSPEPARKFKKKEEEAPAKLLDDLFRKTKTTPCIYWLPLSAETIAIKEEQRRHHMAEHERRLEELRRTHRRH